MTILNAVIANHCDYSYFLTRIKAKHGKQQLFY